MDCFEEIELVISYIEDNLDNGVNYDNISKLTGIPKGLYQRIFSYICGVSIAEYIRKRRLMTAAQKILTDNTSIIETALECGYESHSSFTRAIKEQFGVPPTALTEKIYQSNYYKRFSFHNLMIGGRKIMAELVKIEYAEMSERLVIGVSKSKLGIGERELWDYYFENGIDKKLNELTEFQCTDIDNYIGIGYARDFPDEKSLGDEYIVGKYFETNICIPDDWIKNGLVSRVIPKTIIAKAQIRSRNFNDILNNAYILINDVAKKNNYRLDYSDFYWSEVYTCERFCEPSEKGAGEIVLDWFMPCIKEGTK